MNKPISNILFKTFDNDGSSILRPLSRKSFFLATILFLLIFISFQHAFAQEPGENKRVLFIGTDGPRHPSYKTLYNGFEDRMSQLDNSPIDYSYEYLEWRQNASNPFYPDSIVEFYRQKYKNYKPDLIVAIGSPAAQIVLNRGVEPFDNVPVVFIDTNVSAALVNSSNASVKSAMIMAPFDGKKAIELILLLHPKTETIYVVVGNTERERQLLLYDFSGMQIFFNRVNVVYLTGLTLPQLLGKISSIDGNAGILYHSIYQDDSGKSLVPSEVVRQISQVARVPVYGVYDTYLGKGSIGGYVKSVKLIGVRAAETGMKLLDEKSAVTAYQDEHEIGEYAFDWRELQRWDIDEALLPPGSRIEFKKQDIWALYKWYILGGVSLLLLQSLLIVGFLVNRAKRRWSETKLHERDIELEKDHLRIKLLTAGLETSSNLVVILDEKASIWWINAAFETLSGFAFEEVIGKKSRKFLSERNDPEILSQVNDCLEMQREWRGEIIVCSKDGHDFVDEVSLTPILDKKGENSYYLFVGHDTTERVKARSAQQAALRAQAKAEKIFSIGTMATGISHEINQPLSSIKVITGGILYLHRQGRLLPSDEFIENIEEISAQTDRITSIIKHLRSFIRRGESNLVPCSVNDAIDQALGVVGKKLDAHGVTLHMQMDPSLPLVLAHPMGLEEVVVNLLVNAMEALDTMEKADKQITVKTQFADSVILEISDNGPGIDPQMRETIFDSFISSKVDCENMGLGLAIVKNIVTSYLGTIQLVADSTEGVAFKIELPLIQDGSEGKN